MLNKVCSYLNRLIVGLCIKNLYVVKNELCSCLEEVEEEVQARVGINGSIAKHGTELLNVNSEKLFNHAIRTS